VIHNLVFELTRMGIEVKTLKMRVESLASRLEFNERRARALESVVAYKPGGGNGESPREIGPVPAAADQPALQDPAASPAPGPGSIEGPGQRSRRRRRRRGRRGGPPASLVMGGSSPEHRQEHAAVDEAESLDTAPAAEAHSNEPSAAGEPSADTHSSPPDNAPGTDSRNSEPMPSTEPPGDTSNGDDRS
jgi:hypothetical protein